MVKKGAPSLTYHDVSVTVGDKTYRGKYCVDRGLITVEAYGPDLTRIPMTTQLGGVPADRLAERLLRELIEGGQLD